MELWFDDDRGRLKHVVKWIDSNERLYSCITNAGDHKFANPITKFFLCHIIENAFPPGTTVTVTSGCDRKSAHHGKFCNAIDYFINHYPEGRKAQLEKYITDITTIIQFVDRTNVNTKIGIGIYPQKLIMHLDFEKGPRRWAEVRGGYISMEDGVKEIRKEWESL